MITIRPSTPDEIPQQKELWQKCFGDSTAYIDIFYQQFCTADKVLVVAEDDDINSMAAMLSAEIQFPDGEKIPVGYVYALATNPYMQGKGHARQLLQYADRYLAERGDKAMVLVPANPSLHRFFEALGMIECFALRKYELLSTFLDGDTGGGTMTTISPKEYNAIRESYLQGSFHMVYPDQLVRFQQIGSHLAYGDLYRIDIGGVTGCAAIEYVQRGRLLMKELLIPQEKLGQAVEVVASELKASRYHVRTPVSLTHEGLHGSYVQPFGMIKWYDDDLRSRWQKTQDGYLGLAFD